MVDNVVGLRDRVAPSANGAEPEVIELLENLLDSAKRGEIIAVAVVAIEKNLEIGTMTRSPGANRHLLVAGAAYLLRDACKE